MVPVSVVIPLYNGARWVGDAVASVTAQTGPHELLEITVVDDGSTDNGAALAQAALAGSAIASRVVSTKNGGPSRARNVGWQQSGSEWIQFLDADDVLAPDKIRLHAGAAANMPPDVAVIYSDWKATRLEDGAWIAVGGTWAPALGEDTIASLLQPDQFLSNASCLFRRSWLEAVGGFDERHWLIEDVDLLSSRRDRGRQIPAHRDRRAALQCAPAQPHLALAARSGARFWKVAFETQSWWKNTGGRGRNLSEPRAGVLATIYHSGARYFAAHDRRRFEELVRRIEALKPDFLPESPALLRKISRLVGFRRAELLSVQYRRARGMAKAKPA